MTAVTVPVVQVWDQAKTPANVALVGATVRVTLLHNQATYSNPVVALPPTTDPTTTDSTGYWTVSVAANDLINPSGTTYLVQIEGYNPYEISVPSTSVPVGGWQSSAIVSNPPAAIGVTGAQLPSPVTATGILNVNGNARFHGPDPWFDPNHPTFGAVGDGVTDDATAINAAITAASAEATASGGLQVVKFAKPSIYILGAPAIVPSNVTLDLNGSTLQAKASSFNDVIQGQNFLTLTGTGTNPDNTRGANFVWIRNGTIDGNYSNNITGTTTASNAISVGDTTITFTGAPTGFQNGDTIFLHDTANEGLKLISGAGTTTWTVARTLSGIGGAVAAHNAGITITGGRGYGIRIWGRAYRFDNVRVQNASADGIYTEFAPNVSFASASQELDSKFEGLRLIGNRGHGWTFRGPHDSNIVDLWMWGNGGYGLVNETPANTNGILGNCRGWNSFSNGLGSYYFGAQIGALSDTVASGTMGTGIEFAAGSGASRLDNINIGGHPVGLLLRGQGQVFRGYISTATTDAIQISGAYDCLIDVVGVGNANAVNVTTTEQNANIIRGRFDIPAAGTLTAGTFHTYDAIDLYGAGAGGTQTLYQAPTNISGGLTLSNAGYWSKLFTSGGVIGNAGGSLFLDAFGAAGSVNFRSNAGATGVLSNFDSQGNLTLGAAAANGAGKANYNILISRLTGGGRLSQGSGAPATPNTINPVAGDIYFRTDTPGTPNQRIYICTVGGGTPTWVGIV